MKYLIVTLSIFLLHFSYAQADSNPNFEGLWLTKNDRAVIEISKCDDQLCGDIYWIIEGGLNMDKYNEDEALRNRPLCGLQVLWGFEKESEKRWIDGKIYKADDGDVYNATIDMLPTGDLSLRGYVGIPLFGKSQKWTRVSANDYQDCSVSD